MNRTKLLVKLEVPSEAPARIFFTICLIDVLLGDHWILLDLRQGSWHQRLWLLPERAVLLVEIEVFLTVLFEIGVQS